MNKLIAVALASAFAVGSVSTFAANADLTPGERTELRERAATLQQGRANGQEKVVMKAEATPKVHKTNKTNKKHKTKKASKHPKQKH